MGFFSKDKNKTATPADGGREVQLSDGQSYRVTRQVDCLGDSCPRPQLMTKKALADAALNDVIEVLVDNPSSMEAIPPMLNGIGATHLETVKAARCWEIYIRKD